MQCLDCSCTCATPRSLWYVTDPTTYTVFTLQEGLVMAAQSGHTGKIEAFLLNGVSVINKQNYAGVSLVHLSQCAA